MRAWVDLDGDLLGKGGRAGINADLARVLDLEENVAAVLHDHFVGIMQQFLPHELRHRPRHGRHRPYFRPARCPGHGTGDRGGIVAQPVGSIGLLELGIVLDILFQLGAVLDDEGKRAVIEVLVGQDQEVGLFLDHFEFNQVVGLDPVAVNSLLVNHVIIPPCCTGL